MLEKKYFSLTDVRLGLDLIDSYAISTFILI
jgi:hypothetical protein